MRKLTLAVVGIVVFGGLVTMTGQAQKRRLNPVVELLAAKKPVFGLYAPRNAGGRGRGGAAPAPETPRKTPAELAAEAAAHKSADYIFDGSMEGGVDRAFQPFAEFMSALRVAAPAAGGRLTHPMFVKTPEIAPDPAKAIENISRQLNEGVTGIVFCQVESADELRKGMAAMRFKSKGGTRPENVGNAPAVWGMSEKEYRQKADLWPLNPDGELVNWTIIESRPGLANLREIAAVKGIGALYVGAGTLRGVFTTTGPDGQRVFDEKGWEGAIQQILSACKEFNVPCGYPATAKDIEMRMKQGFSSFIINWGEEGFKAVDIGRKIASRTATSQ